MNKLDDNYNYSTLKLILQKYNYDFDNLSIDNLTEIKIHLDNLNKQEIIEPIKYKSVEIKKIELHNPRYTFFNVLK